MNRCPFLAAINVVRAAQAARLQIDLDEVEEKRRVLAVRQPELATKIAEVYRPKEDRAPAEDPELALYDGFSGDADRFAMKRLAWVLDEDGPWPDFQPRDKRLPVLAERLKARLRPDELSAGERNRWREHVRRCLDDGFGNRPSVAESRAETGTLLAEETDPARRQVLTELAAYEPIRERIAPFRRRLPGRRQALRRPPIPARVVGRPAASRRLVPGDDAEARHALARRAVLGH